MASNILEYTGEIHATSEATEKLRVYPYLPTDDLRDVVNLALYLKRPLLLKGVPGCGKTQLAHAVRYELTMKDPELSVDDPWPMYIWRIKSTTEAREGLYRYDAISRLRDAHLASLEVGGSSLKPDGTPRDPGTVSDYIDEGQLGLAFKETRRRPIVLIDEIDKADIDFPNDLLNELDEKVFVINETGQTVKAELEPIIFITSNDEKDLPDAFLRRCIFHFIDFPERGQLENIITHRFAGQDINEQVVDAAITEFLALRELMVNAKGESGKKVSTSELIDWIAVLKRYAPKDALSKLNAALPDLGVLLKDQEDFDIYRSYIASQAPSGGKKAG